MLFFYKNYPSIRFIENYPSFTYFYKKYPSFKTFIQIILILKLFKPGVPLEFANVCMAMLFFQSKKKINIHTQVHKNFLFSSF